MYNDIKQRYILNNKIKELYKYHNMHITPIFKNIVIFILIYSYILILYKILSLKDISLYLNKIDILYIINVYYSQKNKENYLKIYQ